MSWREFIASLVDSLAWPAGVVLLGLLFRSKIKELLTAGPLRRLKAGRVEAEWHREADKVESAAADAVKESLPRAGHPSAPTQSRPDVGFREPMIRGYAGVLGLVTTLLEESGATDVPSSAPALIELARAKGAISEPTAQAILGLGHLVNLAEFRIVTEAEADEFLVQLAATMYAITEDFRRVYPKGQQGVNTSP